MTSIATFANTAADSILANERPALRRLFDGLELYPNLSATDLRETAKFTEVTNVLGLPVHSLLLPVRDAPASEFAGSLDDLPVETPKGAVRAFRELFAAEPAIVVRGSFAGATACPFRLTVLAPQSAAHLARAFEAMLWPHRSGDTAGSDLAVVVWPDYDDQVLLHLPAEGLAFALGTDDPRAGLIMVVEAAHRRWLARRAAHEGQAREASSMPSDDGWEDIQLLPGGCFPMAAEGGAGLVFAGESIPDAWEQWLVQKIPALAGRDSVECLLAGAEPWVAEGGGWISPFWRNPPLPGRMLAASPDWTRAAEHPDALPFGVRVDERGVVDFAGSNEDAFVVVPRAALVPPHVNTASRLRVAQIWTHKHVKNDATKLWAIGFPKAEII